MHDPVGEADRAGIHSEQVRETLGPTWSERHVAVLLAQGKTIDDVARETARNRTTVKWHIRNIYAGCGLSCQIELAQLVASFVEDPGLLG